MKLTEKRLKKLVLEVLNESQYYKDAENFDTDYGYQAIDIGQSLGDADDRDRAAQVDKYVSLKVNQVLKAALEMVTRDALEDLTNEAASHLGLFSGEVDDAREYARTYDELKSLYERALMRPFKAMREFDGTQESIDAWMDSMESVERILYKARDPGMHYLGKITPDEFIIGDSYSTNRPDEDDDWGYDWERKSVKPRTAVKEAEDFFRPAIMKTILGIQSKKSGMDVGGMFGLDEDKKD